MHMSAQSLNYITYVIIDPGCMIQFRMDISACGSQLGPNRSSASTYQGNALAMLFHESSSRNDLTKEGHKHCHERQLNHLCKDGEEH